MLSVRNDEQIKVGTTTGLVAGSSSFTFDGTGGKPDYRYYNLVVTEIGVGSRGILIKDVDYTWNYSTGLFTLLTGTFVLDQYYNIHFEQIEQPASANPTSLINSSFFIRDINIPDIAVPVSGTNPRLEELTAFIAKYEQDCLMKILGYPLYKLFVSESSSRMTNLLYGAEYIDDCNSLAKWKGLVHDDNISLIANYIYYYYQVAKAKQTTGIGTGTMDIQAGQQASAEDKMIEAWNFFSRETESLISFLWLCEDVNNERVYPEFTAHQYLKTKRLSAPINFLGI